MSTRRRLVSFLGLGAPKGPPPFYSEARYALDGQISSKTPLIERALCEITGGIESIVVLGTREVEARWIESGLFEEIVGRKCFFRPMGHGATEAERWGLFQHVVDALRPTPIAEAGETEAPDEILVDITHGFRSQPILGMAAVSFVVSERARSGVEHAPALRLLYGAFEARTDDLAPVWDLTEFVTAARWNSALDALVRYGRGDDLAALAEDDAREERARAQRSRGPDTDPRQLYRVSKYSQRIGKAARDLADDLALCRLRDVFTRSAPALRGLLSEPDAERLVARLPPLGPSFASLRGWVEPLCAPDVLGSDGLKAMVALAERYGSLQRFAEQAATLREGLITHHARLTGRQGPEPGSAGCFEARKATEMSVHTRAEAAPAWPEAVVANLKLLRGMGRARNDIEHGGLNDQPASATSLREQLAARTKDFARLVGESAGACAQQVPFVNLSNHPVATWDPAQMEAARALGLGEPTELDGGMPLVPAGSDEGEVQALVTNVVERVVAAGASGAHVAGEFTLTVALVHELRLRGVRCFAATTERVSAQGSEAGQSVRVFRFVRWREYRA